MKPIAATIFGSRRDFFWLNSSFAMMASSPKRGFGFDLHFGGIFTSVPTAVAAMAPHDAVVSTVNELDDECFATLPDCRQEDLRQDIAVRCIVWQLAYGHTH